ncbi:MAG: dihydrolipoamide acetyltransferase family protein [Deltaproteobacteria bacterium]|nr:dihydrolipoamide acetyltransferase family protein [Deltaproteobacteria bacterium]
MLEPTTETTTTTTTLDMPSLGADMEKGLIAQWLVKPGQQVKTGEVLLQVETDKGLLDVEAFHDAVIAELLVPEGQSVAVGMPIARLTSTAPAAPAPVSAPTSAVETAPAERVRASPLARRRAAELGIDLTTVAPGPAGRINVDDVERAQQQRSPAGSPSEGVSSMRRAIATAMARSKREIPHYYVSRTVDVTSLLAWLTAENERRAVDKRLLPAALFARAVARAARQVPELNGWWKDDAPVAAADVHLCFATALRGGGLVAPALFHADAQELDTLMAAIVDLVERARAGGLRAREMSEGTLTLTSLGDRGADELVPIIQPPQLCIVGMGRVVERPWIVDGNVVPRSLLHCTLAADHRATDGVVGSRFLRVLEAELAPPVKP